MYLPKTQYIVRSTTGGEFQDSTGTSYKGPYIQTFRGDRFKGTEPQLSPEPLFPITEEVTPSIELFINYYPQPTQQDYERGFFTRYFVQVRSSKKVIEVRKDQFDTVSLRSYNRQSTSWELTGARLTRYPESERSEAAVMINGETITRLNETFPGLDQFVFADQFVR